MASVNVQQVYSVKTENHAAPLIALVVPKLDNVKPVVQASALLKVENVLVLVNVVEVPALLVLKELSLTHEEHANHVVV